MNLERAPSFHSCFPEYFSLPSSAETKSPQDTISRHGSASVGQFMHCITHAHEVFDENTHVEERSMVISVSAADEYTTTTAASEQQPPSSSQRFKQTHIVNHQNSSVVSYHFHSQDKIAPSGLASASQTTLPDDKLSRVGKITAARLTLYVPLYQAALRGDWGKAKEFLRTHPGSLNVRITKGMETVLHIAAGAKHTTFVEELVKLMSPMDLAFRNKYNNTALCFAALSGITRIAKVMVDKNKILPGIRGNKGVTPLHIAALLGHRNMVWYLLTVTDEKDLTQEDYIGILIATITTNLFDVALHIIRIKPHLAILRDPNGETALHALAQKPSAFFSKSGLGVWQRYIYQWICVDSPIDCSKCATSIWKYQKDGFHRAPGIKAIYEEKLLHVQASELLKELWEQFLLLEDSEIAGLLRGPSRPLFVATEFGIVEFVTELVHSYPDLIWKVDVQSRTIFHIAVIHRQEKIFNLIHDIGAHKDMITSYRDTNNQNILHLAGKLAPSNRLNIVSGAALQMQRELLWFKEVEKVVQPLYKEMRDANGRTPRMLFTEEHRGLLKEGERWMKNTASSCMLVATLITTVVFTAVFTAPGGNNQSSGIPIFLRSTAFVNFSIANASALFASVTSIFMFLSILTSRYAEEDFLCSLPVRLIIGLVTLFFSIACMLVAFGSALFIVLDQRVEWIAFPVVAIACSLVFMLGFLQFPLLADMIQSSFRAGIFRRKKKDMLYY